ncbi:transposase, partial [Marinobacter sp. G11]|uniref:transposase n=1 Tax=Marinobacter sp. G11 TaxID=2903522 RepID=UPI001E47BC7F
FDGGIRQPARVAALPWNQWQLSRGMGGRLRLESVATLVWNTHQYPQISRSWQSHWDNLITIFEYPPAIRKVIYTTNAIESLNSVIRKATKRRKLFPSDDSALKVAFLAIQQASKKWTMPIRDWKPALNRFIIEFGDRLDGHL